MARYEITGPDGSRYEVTAPDGASEQDVFSVFQSQFGNSVSPVDRPAPIPRPGSEMPRQRAMPQRAAPSPQQGAAPPPMQAQPMVEQPRTEGFAAPGGALNPAALPKPVDPIDDVLYSAAAGTVRGGLGLVGLPGSIEWLGRAGINKIGEMVGAQGNVVSPQNMFPSGADLTQGFERNVATLYKPKTVAGEYANTIGEFAPGVLMPAGAGGMLGKVASNWLAPAIASETAGQATKGTELEPYARVAGALAGGYIPRNGARIVSPNPTPPEKARHAAVLDREGVRMTAGDRGSNRVLKWAEDVTQDMPFSGGPLRRIKTGQGEDFTRAALRRAGINADRATPDVLDQAARGLGNQFQAMAAATTIMPTAAPLRALDRIAYRYERNANLLSRDPRISNVADEIRTLRQNNTPIHGQQYAKWRSDLESAARGTQDAMTRNAFREMSRALDLAVEVSMRNPDMRRQWRTLRTRYRNFLAIREAASRAGEKAADGIITPANLASASKAQGKAGYVRGLHPMQDLADAGVSMLSPLPQSGTAPRLLAQNLPYMVGAGALGAGGILPAAASVAMPALMSHALMSRPVQAYLGNQLAGNARNALSGRGLPPTGPQTRWGAIKQRADEMGLPAIVATSPQTIRMMNEASPPLEVTVYPPGDPRNRR